MNPEDFQLLVIPFTQTAPVDGRPPLLPPGLPHEFAKVRAASYLEEMLMLILLYLKKVAVNLNHSVPGQGG